MLLALLSMDDRVEILTMTQTCRILVNLNRIQVARDLERIGKETWGDQAWGEALTMAAQNTASWLQ